MAAIAAPYARAFADVVFEARLNANDVQAGEALLNFGARKLAGIERARAVLGYLDRRELTLILKRP